MLRITQFNRRCPPTDAFQKTSYLPNYFEPTHRIKAQAYVWSLVFGGRVTLYFEWKGSQREFTATFWGLTTPGPGWVWGEMAFKDPWIFDSEEKFKAGVGLLLFFYSGIDVQVMKMDYPNEIFIHFEGSGLGTVMKTRWDTISRAEGGMARLPQIQYGKNTNDEMAV
jgi:hypothetical protein